MWQEKLSLLIDTLQYEKSNSLYMKHSYIQRLFLPKPVKPSEHSSWELARQYVLAYNQEKNFIPQKETFGEYAYIKLSYNDKTYYPELVCIIYHNQCFWESKKVFSEDGSYVEYGIEYPYSECGFTLKDSNWPTNFQNKKKKFESLCQEMSSFLSSINNTF